MGGPDENIRPTLFRPAPRLLPHAPALGLGVSERTALADSLSHHEALRPGGPDGSRSPRRDKPRLPKVEDVRLADRQPLLEISPRPSDTDHADYPQSALDLGRPVGNEAVLAVERLARGLGSATHSATDSSGSTTASSSAGPAPAPWWATYT